MAWQNAGGQQTGNMAEGNGVQAYTLQGMIQSAERWIFAHDMQV